MTPRVCTILSAREWESDLVALAHETAGVRLVLRAYRPQDVEDASDLIDVVVAGAETSWVTPAHIAAWRRRGLRVVGICPAGDAPSRDLLEIGGCDEIFPDDTPTEVLLQALRLLQEPPALDFEPEGGGRLVAVTGPRGAPGRTEVALCVAWSRTALVDTILLDLDQEAPALAVRLGVPPRPDLADAVDAVRQSGSIGEAIRRVNDLPVVVGSHRPGENLLRPALLEEVVEAARGSFEMVVCDLGPRRPDDPLIKQADEALVVVEASAVGLVRAARLVAEWAGPLPGIVLNRVDPGQKGQVLAAARRWLGLEPVALVPEAARIRRAARGAAPPDGTLRRALGALEIPA